MCTDTYPAPRSVTSTTSHIAMPGHYNVAVTRHDTEIPSETNRTYTADVEIDSRSPAHCARSSCLERWWIPC